MQDCDVLVVGAGLAGLQASRLLASLDLRVMLVDRKPRLDQSVHTTGIFVRRTLEDFWLPADCLGPPVRHVKLYSPARRCLPLESPHEEFRIGRMGPLYLRMLDAALEAGVEFRSGTSFLSASAFEGDGAAQCHNSASSRSPERPAPQAEHHSLVLLERAGRREPVLARYVVGADGTNSRVARELGLSRNREWIVGVEEVFQGVPLEGSPCLHCFLDPRLAPGYIAWLAHDGEEAHLGVGGYPSRFDPNRALDEFRREATRWAPLERGACVERRGGRIPVGGVLPDIVNRRGLLVGDAAGAVSPLTAGGLDPCLRQSALAATVIEKHLRGGGQEVLAPYHAAPFRRRFRTRRWLRRALSALRRPWLGELAFSMARVFPLNRLVWHIYFGRGSFPDSPALDAPAALAEEHAG